MAKPEVRLLDEIHIDDGRAFIEFRFSDTAGNRQAVQIDFGYVETLAAVFQQAFLSATLSEHQGESQGENRGENLSLGQDWLAVPRADIDHPVSVGVDVMSGRVVAMFLLGSPFQVCYALPRDSARMLSRDLQMAADEAHAVQSQPRN
ncbi:MAG TPA: hypothetical protein VHB27_13640 [Rhodopila sp.]|uniref:hypothetical protein n=1 Tax=Rhodopila sp. TaxID=2480087 RepID=UPI002C937CE4|nr:hypothetical protein [Rhodopila sp.]HVY16262.1 hypothetical protein [Rhodopila sp.]